MHLPFWTNLLLLMEHHHSYLQPSLHLLLFTPLLDQFVHPAFCNFTLLHHVLYRPAIMRDLRVGFSVRSQIAVKLFRYLRHLVMSNLSIPGPVDRAQEPNVFVIELRQPIGFPQLAVKNLPLLFFDILLQLQADLCHPLFGFKLIFQL